MKIAITADSPAENAPVSAVFGRCAYYAIYDTATGKFAIIQNPGGMMARGAGVQAAQFVIAQGVQIVITGGMVGPNASMVLAQAGIEVVSGFQGTIGDAIQATKEGRLQGAAPSYPSMPTYYPANPYEPIAMTPEDELRMLEEEKAYIEERLEDIKKRLKELKK